VTRVVIGVVIVKTCFCMFYNMFRWLSQY